MLVLAEAAKNLEELNIRAALDKLKTIIKTGADRFMKGYRSGRGLPPAAGDLKIPPKVNLNPKAKGKKGKGKKKYQKKPVEKKGKVKKDTEAEKRQIKRQLKTGQCQPAPKVPGKIRCPKPGGGWRYFDKGSFEKQYGKLGKKKGKK